MPEPSAHDPTALLAAARALGPLILASREESERERHLPPALVRAMAEAGLFRLYLPRRLGGFEVDLVTFNRVVQEVARFDGAAGWLVAVGGTYGALAGYLDEAVAWEIFGRDPTVLLAGTINPTGRAVAVAGGYRVSGRWAYGSGIRHCAWALGNCVVLDGDQPRRGPDGAPEMRIMLFPAAACQIHDTWHVAGLRGTGSHDYSISDEYVPAERSLVAFTARPTQPGTLYACPFGATFAASIAAPLLGLARGAIDALVELAGAKTPTGASGLLRDRPAIQADIARAEGLSRSARAFLFESLAATWDEVAATGQASLTQRAIGRVACTQAAQQAAQAVDLMYHAGGGTALYQSCPLERFFRDAHAATQHIAVAPTYYELAGRVLLGLDPGTTRF